MIQERTLKEMRSDMSEMLSVVEAAQRLGVNPSRVHARIREGSLAAEKIGNQWVIALDDLRHISRHAGPGRPLSPRSAWALLAVAAKSPAVRELSPSDRSKARSRLRDLIGPASFETSSVEATLDRVLGNRASRRLLVAAPRDLASIRADERVHVSGVSRPESNMSAGDSVEGYVSVADLPDLVDDYLLSDASRRRANVVLHVVGGDVGLRSLSLDVVAASPLAIAADLAEYGNVRELGEAVRILGELAEASDG